MDVADLLLQVKRQYGDEYGVIITDDDLYQFIYEGEMDIIRSTGGYEAKILNTPASSFPLLIPAAIQVIRVTLNSQALTYISIPELDLMMATLNIQKDSLPQYWYSDHTNGEHVALYPASSEDTVVNVHYKHTPFKRTSTTDPLTIPEKYHTDLLQFCLAKCHNKNRDAQSEQSAMNVYSQNLAMRREEGYSFEGPIYKQHDPADWDY